MNFLNAFENNNCFEIDAFGEDVACDCYDTICHKEPTLNNSCYAKAISRFLFRLFAF